MILRSCAAFPLKASSGVYLGIKGTNANRSIASVSTDKHPLLPSKTHFEVEISTRDYCKSKCECSPAEMNQK